MYLEEIDSTESTLNRIIFINKKEDLKAGIKDFETAVEIRKIVFIELGIELKIEKFKVFGKEED
jgi:hypothetical protein